MSIISQLKKMILESLEKQKNSPLHANYFVYLCCSICIFSLQGIHAKKNSEIYDNLLT